MHPAVAEWVAYAIKDWGPFKRVLEVGSRDMNGSVRPQFEQAGCDVYLGNDIQPGPGADEVLDFGARTLGTDESWDCVVCAEVLEHAPNAGQLVCKAFDHLDPGGVFVATMAYTGRGPHSAIVEGPPQPGEFYRNVTEEDLLGWLLVAGFPRDGILIDTAGVDIRCIARR